MEGRCDCTSPYLPGPGKWTCNLPPYTAGQPKIYPASTSETGHNSSAGLGAPPLVLLLPVGPLTLPVSDHELSRQWLVDLCTGKRPPLPPNCEHRAGSTHAHVQQQQTRQKMTQGKHEQRQKAQAARDKRAHADVDDPRHELEE